ncbi:hypothetical protein BDR26DRAFT_924154 [Obelidium mucronatum]|nr:hypothetical protein BDR26DRAFT_924154 [Obelidium mucronatum]
MRSLVTRNSQNVKIITMNGAESAQYLPKFCQNRLCRWGAFDVDSCVFKDKEGSVRLYYQMEIIKTRGYIFLNDKYLITWDTLEWLCVDVVKDLKAKFWTSQQMYCNKFGQNALPAPADLALFKRSFVLFGFLRLAEWIKSHPSFTNSTPGLVTPEGFAIIRVVVGGDTKTMDDMEEGMILYSQWFESNFVVKNKHLCELCHQVGLHEEVLSAIVDDGKVMVEAATCFVYGCSQLRRNFEASGFGNAQKASQVYACSNQSHIEIETQVRAKGVDPANKFYNRKQATQRRGKNIKSKQVSTCHQERHEAPQTGFVKFGMHEYFLPCLFTLVWSCGVIANVRKMYTFESTDDIILLLVETFDLLGEVPSHLYFDKNCLIFRSIAKMLREHGDINENSPPFFVSLLCIYLHVLLLLDEFHFLRHTEAFCNYYCNPLLGKQNCARAGVSDFNTQIAEQTNVWFGQIAHIMRYFDAVQHDFMMWSLVDMHNEQIETDLLTRRMKKESKT